MVRKNGAGLGRLTGTGTNPHSSLVTRRKVPRLPGVGAGMLAIVAVAGIAGSHGARQPSSTTPTFAPPTVPHPTPRKGCLPWAPDGAPPMDSLLAAWDWGASSATLVHDLDLLSHSRLRLITGGKALAVAADASVLEREIAREIPPAGWVYEAVGRARFLRVADGGFLGTEIDTQFQNLNSAYQASGCEPLFSSVSLADLRGLSPSPLGNTGVVYKGSLYGYPCSGPKAYEPPLSLVFGCRDQSLDVLNGSTGVFQGAQFPIPGNELQISGNYAAWATLNTAPARGLTAPTWSVTVHVRTLLGAPVANTVVVPSQPEQTGMHGTIVNFLGGPTGFVIGTRNEATDAYTVTYLSPQGKIVDTQPVGPLGPNAISVLSSHTFLIAERPCSSPECQGTSREPAIYDSGDKDLLPAAAHRGDKWH